MREATCARTSTSKVLTESDFLHELRMLLSKFVCGNIARFSGHFSFTESAHLSGVISFAAKSPSYASGFTLH